MKKTILLLLLIIFSTAVYATERTGDTYTPNEDIVKTMGVNVCDSSTQPTQCAYVNAASAPPFVKDTLTAQGAIPNEACGNILILSSGNPSDSDTELSTDMGNAGCGLNPDGYNTYDCVDLTYTAPANSVVLAISSEWPEWIGSSFTDWMRIGGIVDVSISDWVGDGTLATLGYGPSNSGTVTLATLSQDSQVGLRVADSGDHILDTALIVVPISCFEDEPEPILCGNGVVEPGEQCDDGNKQSGDGCSATCLIEEDNGDIPEFTLLSGIVVIGLLGLFIYRRRK